jgi:hypothetical protein
MINPATSAKFVSLDYRPIYERVAELQREKSLKLQQLRAQLSHEEVENGVVFAPQIDERSRRIVERKLAVASAIAETKQDGIDRATGDDSGGAAAAATAAASADSGGVVGNNGDDVGSRLFKDATVLAKKKQQLLAEREKELAESMQPVRPSKGTEEIALKSAHVR